MRYHWNSGCGILRCGYYFGGGASRAKHLIDHLSGDLTTAERIEYDTLQDRITELRASE